VKKIAADRNYRMLKKQANDEDFLQRVVTSSHPDLIEARDNLMNAIGAVLTKEGFIGSADNDKLKSMWDGMKDEQMRSVEYAALYSYLYQVFGKRAHELHDTEWPIESSDAWEDDFRASLRNMSEDDLHRLRSSLGDEIDVFQSAANTAGQEKKLDQLEDKWHMVRNEQSRRGD